MTALWIPPVYGDTGACVRLLREYFTRQRAKGGPYYTGAHFERLAGGGDRPETADRFTADDLLAITMLSVSVEPHGAVELLTDPDGHWHRLLAAIPRDARLEDPSRAPLIAPGGPAAELWERLANPHGTYPGKPDGVGPVVAGKLLARKRPHLVPVYDVRVKALFRRPKVDGTFWSALADALRADGGALRTRLVELRAEAGIGEDIGVLRVLDVIAWMHRDGVGPAAAG
ncbi:DUF6308 family protein [Kitasatospora sp. NPDC036755]|uniref:DUF6308 family protein n=1 Tax=Kitasatospora sp. NPDC036755 TaxID=3154600 RepID=UPI0033E87D5C